MQRTWRGAAVLAVAIGLLGAGRALLMGVRDAMVQKSGGILKGVVRDTPPPFSIHESATNEPVWSMSPIYNNLVYYDPLKKRESLDGITGELAEKWNWSADGKTLTFQLRKGVQWHDGKPFTSNDVKVTFDAVRGAKTSGMRLNPRKAWYANVKDIVVKGDHEVSFVLTEPQLSLLKEDGDWEAANEYIAFANAFLDDVRLGNPLHAWERMLDGINAPGTWARIPQEGRAIYLALTNTLCGVCHANFNHATTFAEVRTFASPTTVLHGATTHSRYRRMCELLAAQIPGARLAVLPMAGHMSPLTHPEMVADALLTHLDSH